MKLSELAANKPPKILLYSEVGAGKTALTLTLGSRLQIIDMDDGLKTGLTVDDPFKSARLEVDVRQFIEKEPHKRAIAFKQCKEFVYGLPSEIAVGKWKFDALAVDSLTTFAESAVAYVMSNSGKLGNNPEIQHWGLAFTEIKNVLGVLRSLPVVFVLLAHEKIKSVGKGDDEETRREIAVAGKNLATEIAKYFDEIWYLRAKPAGGGKFTRVLQTVSDSLTVARSRSCLLNMTDTSIGMWALIEKLGYKPPEGKE